MKANKNSVGSERKNINREANIDINIDKDSDKSPQSILHKIALNKLIRDFQNEKLQVKDLKDHNKSLKKEIQIYKDEQNKKYNQKNLPVNGINLIIINKDETIEKLKEENKRLKEEIDEENYKIKKLEEINNDVLRQFVAINANKRLRNGTDESKQLLENLQKLDPKLCFDDNENQKEEEKSEEEKSEEEKSEEEKSEEESMKGNSVDHYISSKNTEAKNQNNNVDDLKTEDDTANLKRIDINEQHI